MKLTWSSASSCVLAVLAVMTSYSWKGLDARRVPTTASAAGLVKATPASATAFEPNLGQTDPEVRFLSRRRGYTLFLANAGATLVVRRPRHSRPGASAPAEILSSGQAGRQAPRRLGLSSPYLAGLPESSNARVPPSSRNMSNDAHTADSVLRMKLLGVNPDAKITGLGMLPGRTNYFTGNNPRNWRTNVPRYEKVDYRGVYPGVDLVYYGRQGQLEYDFIVAPGADPAAIRLKLDAASGDRGHLDRRRKAEAAFDTLRIAPDGDLLVKVDSGEVRFHKPCHLPAGGALPLTGRSIFRQERCNGGRWPLQAEWGPIKWHSRSGRTIIAVRW